MYQVNSGVLIKRGIQPDTLIRFTQPSCANSGASPCNPKRETYAGKSYLVLGDRRQSTDSRPQFALEMPYDFIGVPIEPRFCGNTININTLSFRKYIEYLDRELFDWEIKKNIGYYHRNLEIDTQNVPSYNEVNLEQWQRSKRALRKRKHHKRGKNSDVTFKHANATKKHHHGLRQRDDTQPIKCEPSSDRINIDELTHLDASSGRITINTGAGKDVLSINSMIGKLDSSKEDFLVSDLGDDGNLLSLGNTVGVGRERGKLLGGVIFDNTGGHGKICFLKEDLKSQRCVGNARRVTIFKGSR